MLGLVKVGWTTDLEARVRKLSSVTGVPTPFVVAWACGAASMAIGRLAHDRLARHRVNDKREFFRCDVPTAIRAIQACNVPLGRIYGPKKRPWRAGKGAKLLSAARMASAILRAICGACLRHPVVACMMLGVFVAVYRPDIPAWMPQTAIRVGFALERLR